MATHPLHEKAKMLVKDFLTLEVQLIKLLQEIEQGKVHFFLGYRSLFQYATVGLGLAENQAYTLIGVGRKCTEVPLLQAAIEEGTITASKAKKILPVIEPGNASDWLEKSQRLVTRELEQQVASHHPEKNIRPHIKPVSATTREFRCAVNLQVEKDLLRCKELLGPDWNKVLGHLTKAYLEKQDPVEKAERVLERKQKEEKSPRPTGPQTLPVKDPAKTAVTQAAGSSRHIPVLLKHQVHHRDQGRCQHPLPNGMPCGYRQGIQIHHITALSQGGKHTLDNLKTLCAQHHASQHDFEGAIWKERRRQVL